MGGIHIDLTEVEIEVDEGSLGVREPVSAVGGYKNDIYICREVKEVVQRDNKAKDAIIVDGVIDWDDVDVPQPDQILANKTQIAQYQKNVEAEARKGYKIRNSLLALREKMKADLVQQLALRYETATDSVTDIENMLGDAVDEYETFDNENEEELEQLLEELEEERENAGESENPDPDAGGGEE